MRSSEPAQRPHSTLPGSILRSNVPRGTKLHAVTDARGRPIRFFMTAGQRLYRGEGIAEQSSGRGLAAGRPGMRRRLVARGPCWQEDNALHSWSKVTRHPRQIRQAPLPKAQPDRNHVRTFEGLEARRNTLQQMPEGLPLTNRSRCDRDLLVMRPEPGAGGQHRLVSAQWKALRRRRFPLLWP